MRLLVITLVLSVASLALASTHPDDKAALVALYNSANGADWSPNNWSDVLNGDPCDDVWPTTTPLACTGAAASPDRRVTVLNLAFNNMAGPIPDELSDMVSLTFLGLDGSRLTGTLPNLSGMTNLTHFSAHTNLLEGTVENLPPTLEELALNYNSFSGEFPACLQAMTGLTQLNLGWNDFSGDLPEWFADFSALEKVRLLDNGFTGPLPDLSGMPALTEFTAGDNQFSGSLWDARPAALTKLTLSTNLLTGIVPAWVGDQELTVIDLWENPFDCPVGVDAAVIEHAHVNCACPPGQASAGPAHACRPCSENEYTNIGESEWAFAGVDKCTQCPDGGKQSASDPRRCEVTSNLLPLIIGGSAAVVGLFVVVCFRQQLRCLAVLLRWVSCGRFAASANGDHVDESYKPLGDGE